MIPAVQSADEQQPGAGATLVAEVAAGAIAIIPAEAILAAADRAWPMPIDEEPRVDPELWQDFAPASGGTFDRAHHGAVRRCALA